MKQNLFKFSILVKNDGNWDGYYQHVLISGDNVVDAVKWFVYNESPKEYEGAEITHENFVYGPQFEDLYFQSRKTDFTSIVSSINYDSFCKEKSIVEDIYNEYIVPLYVEMEIDSGNIQ